METQNEKTLLKLKEAGAIQLVPSRLPVYQNPQPEEPGTNLISILRLLIRNSADKEKDLQKITERDLLEACNQITEQKNDSKLPPHFIPPIRRFGNSELDEKDLNYLRLLKKDHKDSTNPELVLKLIKQYHENHDSKFTEQTWLKHLHIPMPTSTLQLINRAQLKNDANLHTLWEDILHSFGSTRDNASIIASIYRVTKTSTHPLNMIKEIADLVDQGTDRVSELESVALYEVQRAINQMIGPAAASSMHVLFELQPRKTIRSYYNMANQSFYDLLNQPVKTKLHHLAETPIKSPIEEKMDALINTVNNIQTKIYSCHRCNKPDHLAANCTQAKDTRTCHNCGAVGHLASQCRRPKRGKEIYRDCLCAIHPRSRHTNFQCNEQSTPCYFRENHTNHKMAECQRTESLDQIFREPNFTSNAEKIFNRPSPANNQGNPNLQTLQGTETTIDHQTKAALIDLIAKTK